LFLRFVKLIKPILVRILPPQYIRIIKFLEKAQWRVEKLERNMQRLNAAAIYQAFGTAMQMRPARSVINRHEFSVYSQNGEDGILLYVFSQIGTTNRCFVEFGVADGRECNTANLLLNFGWQGLMMEAASFKYDLARSYFDILLGDEKDRLRILNTLVTAENINTLLSENHVPAEPDLLSIDIDSNDYWVWQAIEVVRPRVVIVEYNPVYGVGQSLTIPYQRGMFDRFDAHPNGLYFGASLAALTRLAHHKGYVLVGCDSTGTNAVFVRQDVLTGTLKPLTPQEAFYQSVEHYLDVDKGVFVSPQDSFAHITHLEFVEIEDDGDPSQAAKP
jgi:hypothetical protein